MAGHSYEEAKKLVYKGLLILAVVTIVEVIISLFGKGWIIPYSHGTKTQTIFLTVAGVIIIALSLYKAYYIIFEFMHMRYEAKVLVRTVLLPFVLLIWAIIAFLWEGDYWKDSRSYVLLNKDVKNEQSIKPVTNDQKGTKMFSTEPEGDHSADESEGH